MFNQGKSNKGVLLRHEPSRVHWLGDLLHLPAAKGIKTPQKNSYNIEKQQVL